MNTDVTATEALVSALNKTLQVYFALLENDEADKSRYKEIGKTVRHFANCVQELSFTGEGGDDDDDPGEEDDDMDRFYSDKVDE